MDKENPGNNLTPEQQQRTYASFNQEIAIVEKTGNAWRLRIRLKHGPLAQFYGRFFPLRDYHEYIVDGLGLAIVKKFVQNPVTVASIIQEFMEEHLLSFHEARILVTTYLAQLMRRGIAVMEIPKDH